MASRVAVASSDGKYVNQHFGRATQFLVFEINDRHEYQFIELRPNEPSCPGEQAESNKHLAVIRLLADCQAVLVSQIGPGAAATLSANGIQAHIIPNFIEEALAEYITTISS